MVNTDFLLFGGTASLALARQIAMARCFGQSLGVVDLQRFSDGEMRPTLQQNVQGKSVCVVQSTAAPADRLMELLLILNAARRAGARRLAALVPYAGYGRQDKMHTARSALGAELHDQLIASAGAHHLLVCDPHAEASFPTYGMKRRIVSAFALLAKHIDTLSISNLLFAAPDAGAYVHAQRYATHFGTAWVKCCKQRTGRDSVQVQCTSSLVRNANVVLIDDMIDTAGTICAAAQCLKQQGAQSVRACCTHLVLSGEAHQRIENSVLKEVIATDTLQQTGLSQKYTVLTMADVFAEALEVLI